MGHPLEVELFVKQPPIPEVAVDFKGLVNRTGWLEDRCTFRSLRHRSGKFIMEPFVHIVSPVRVGRR